MSLTDALDLSDKTVPGRAGSRKSQTLLKKGDREWRTIRAAQPSTWLSDEAATRDRAADPFPLSPSDTRTRLLTNTSDDAGEHLVSGSKTVAIRQCSPAQPGCGKCPSLLFLAEKCFAAEKNPAAVFFFQAGGSKHDRATDESTTGELHTRSETEQSRDFCG